jgi:GWxTD domain-containing protein
MRLRSIVLSVSILLSVSVSGFGKDLTKLLPPRYREWVNRDVAYIITDDEKQAFLRLSSDADREKFIDRFWEIRNPTPGSPTNTYKEEIYRRIAYADQWFGHYSGVEGWRTDRGRVYITLGAPQQVGKYLGLADIRPMEIWFYQSPGPALPPFFYVVFYQAETNGEFKLYSPFMDGPDKLVTGPYEGNRVQSWRLIDHDAGREVSRTVLSLIPTEPVDMETATSSLTSDMLLSGIRNYANLPANKDLLEERRRLLESVTHRVILHGAYLDVLTVPLVDAEGETNLHYVLRLKEPGDFSVAEDKDERYYYSASVATRVLTPEGKLIFTQERKFSQVLDDKQLVKIKNRVFGYEGVLPLPPGKYKLEFQLTDEIKHTSYTSEREVVVPQRPSDGMRITEVVPFSEATGGQLSYLPFSAAGVRFTPVMGDPTLAQGQDLEFFYQVWAPPKDSGTATSGNLEVQYAYGRMGMHDTHTLTEEVAQNQFAANGTIINGKKISTSELGPGAYRMEITVKDPATQKRAFASFQFQISDGRAAPLSWDVTDPMAGEDVRKGTRDYHRALCYISQGDQPEALTYLRNAYKKDPSEPTRDKLVTLLYSRQGFSEVADLYAQGGITAQTGEQTILDMAESLNRLGHVAKSIQLLQSALPLRQSSVLYMGLARYYQIAGDSEKASEMEQKAKSLAAAPTS